MRHFKILWFALVIAGNFAIGVECANHKLLPLNFLTSLDYALGQSPGQPSDREGRLREIIFFPFLTNDSPCDVVFVDGSIFYETENNLGVSAGIGQRSFYPSLDIVTGVNFYYDYYNFTYGSFHQIGLGTELFIRSFEIRCNFYLPCDSKVRKGRTEIFDNYIGNYLVTCQKRNRTAKGFDFELGKTFSSYSYTGLYLGLGGYHYTLYRCSCAFGYKATFRSHYLDKLYIELNAYHDKIFNHRFKVTLGMVASWKCLNLPRNLIASIYRKNRIAANKCCHYKTNY